MKVNNGHSFIHPVSGCLVFTGTMYDDGFESTEPAVSGSEPTAKKPKKSKELTPIKNKKSASS